MAGPDTETPDTMPPFNTPTPTTYNGLLEILNDNSLPFSVSSLDYARIEQAATQIAELETDPEISSDLRATVRHIEALGVKGWVDSILEKRRGTNHAEVEAAFDATCNKAEELEEEVLVLEKRVEVDERLIEKRVREDTKLLAKRIKEDARVLKHGSSAAELQGDAIIEDDNNEGMGRHDSDDLKEIKARIANLEMMMRELKPFGKINEEDGEEVTRNPETNPVYSDRCYFDNSADFHADQHQWGGLMTEPGHTSRSSSECSKNVEAGSSFGSHDYDFQTHNLMDPTGISYAGDGKIMSETKAAMLQEVEETLWAQEQRDSNLSLSYASRNHTKRDFQLPHPPVVHTTTTGIQAPTSYIYIPLLPNFTIPQQRLPSLTFRSAAAVLHFPQGATRDQLVAVLRERHREGLPVPVSDLDLELEQGVNVIRIRTHNMEWELKNAVMKNMKQTEWENGIGKVWRTEGEGVTYIVSKPDIYFSRVGEEVDADRDIEGHPYTDAEKKNKEAKCLEGVLPNLRGGAGSPNSERTFLHRDDREDSLTANSDQGDRFDFHNCIEVLDGIPVDEEKFFEKEWIEYSRLLELQNIAQVQAIKRLQEITRDMEGTLEWQDEELTMAEHNESEWRRIMILSIKEMKIAQAETKAAKKETEFVKMQLLQFQVQEIVDRSVADFNEDSREDSNEPNPMPAMRGGGAPEEQSSSSCSYETDGGGTLEQQSSSSHSSETESLSTDPRTDDIQATSFYFFPSVSTIVLLDKPVRYLQWPSGTTLEQVYSHLKDRHTSNSEDNAYFRRVREILEIREELGVPLPDTSEGRQVLVKIPEIPEGTDSRTVGIATNWEKSFGPDEYERLMRGGMKFLELEDTHEGSRVSPPDSEVDRERFDDTSDLIDLVDRVEMFANGSRTPVIVSPPSGFAEPALFAPTEAEQAMQSLDRDLDTLSVDSESTNPSINPEQPPLFNSNTPTPTPTPTLTTPNPPIETTRTKRPPLPHRRTTRSAVPEASSYPHPARMRDESIWNLIRLPSSEIEEDELTRSASFDYELGLGKTIAQQDAEEAKENTMREEKKYGHRKGEGCESWIPWTDLPFERTVCEFCQLPFTSGSPTVHEWSGYDSETPMSRTRRNSPKKVYGSGGSSDDDGDFSRGRTAKRAPPSDTPSVFNPYMRGGAATAPEAEHWGPKCCQSQPPRPIDLGCKRPRAPYYHDKGRALAQRHRYKLYLQNLRVSGDGASTSLQRKERSVAASEYVEGVERTLCRSGDIAPPNSPTRDEYAKRFFQTFPNTAGNDDVQQSPPISPRSSRSVAKGDQEWGHAEGHAGVLEETEENQGPWVPETVAGPSEDRKSRRVDSVVKKEEYDGMMWGGY